MKRLMKASTLALVALLVTATAVLANGAGGVTGPAFYVDGDLYRTVGTPTDLSGTGAPASTFDAIYDIGGAQAPVAEAAPGDHGYNGGRWQVHALSFNTDYATTLAAHDLNGSGMIDSVAEVSSALADGGAAGMADNGVVASFECPVIKLRPNS